MAAAWESAPLADPPGKQPAWMAAPVEGEAKTEKPSRGVAGVVGDLVAGAVRGAGSIGATLLWPIDKAQDMYYGDREPGLSGLITGQQPLSRNEERRQSMDEALRTMGADTASTAFGAGKLAGEIAGTAGAGGAVANTVGRVAPSVAARAPALLEAISTGGMKAGGATGAAGLAARTAGGAVAGAASAGLVNPEDAGSGAAVGAVLPGVLQAAGKAGNAVGRAVAGPAQSAEQVAAINAAREAGYVIPPTQAKPSLGNRLMEGLAGKISTAQNASARNQQTTNALAAKALGLAADQPITPQALKGVRDTAAAAYDSVRNLGAVNADAQFAQDLMSITNSAKNASQSFPGLVKNDIDDVVESLNQKQFDAGGAVDAIRILRDKADSAYAKGEKSAGKAYKAAAGALESQLERALAAAGDPDALGAFRDARTLIAKTYSVEKAMNPTTGTVDARKLASQLAKGKPLSGELKDAADFAARFPKAAQAVEGMGSLPQTSPLDWAASGAVSAATANPLMLAGVAARPAARGVALSSLVQNRLTPRQGGRLADLLSADPVQALPYRAAPVLATDR